MSMHSLYNVILTALLLVATAVLAEGTHITGIASVIDGDTIEIRGQRIRLLGIDAPESSQLCVRPNGERWRCGQRASFAQADRIGRAIIRCEQRDIDRSGRVVAVCFKGAEDLDRWMVANGRTVAFRRYFFDYISDEYAVRQKWANIWSGNFEMPWDWRALH